MGSSLTTKDTGKFDIGPVHVEILAPGPYLALKGPGSADRRNRAITSNSISAVIRLSSGGKPILLLAGDIDQVGFENMLDDSQDLSPLPCFHTTEGTQAPVILKNSREYSAREFGHKP